MNCYYDMAIELNVKKMTRYKLFLIEAIALLLLACGSPSNDFPGSMTSTENPLPPCPDSPNCVRVSVPFNADSGQQLYQALSSALDKMNAFSISEIPEDQAINSVFKIPVFGWLDDVNIIIEEKEDSLIANIRSASRVGYYDLGVNKRRVKKLVRLTHKKLTN